jgi:hypothetical protein
MIAPAFKTRLHSVGYSLSVRFDTKIDIVVRNDLAVWQKLNITAFLASGIASCVHEVIGAPYRDGSGNAYAPMFRQPVTILAGDAVLLREAFERSTNAGLACAVYTQQLFETGNDDDNRAAVARVAYSDLELAGFSVYGPRNRVDRALKGLRLHT